MPFAELKLPNVAKHYDALAQFLLDHNFVDGTVHRFTRTVDGAELVRETAEKYSLTV